MIRNIEELSMNAFPSLDSLYYDGWIIRMSEGKSKRVNSVYPLYPSSIESEEKIKYCEQIFEENRLRRVFKLTEMKTCKGLDQSLRSKGYRESGRTLLQNISLDDFDYDSYEEFEFLRDFSKEWYRDLCDAENRSALDSLVVADAWKKVAARQCYIAIKKNGKRIAFARGVLERGYIGIYSVFVCHDFRGRGLGESLTRELMAYGKRAGCKEAYLQVEYDNAIARKLYKQIGFRDMYQYWYLLKEIGEK
jgi:ribosomal protein S18 acetylase RimI-like enzyme